MKNHQDWMTLSQVADYLGVHPSTVRLWSDKGRIPVVRTMGNHRRYLRTEVELWSHTRQTVEALGADTLIQKALTGMRFRIQETHLETEDWYLKLSEEARLHYRMSGRLLVQGLTNFLSCPEVDARAEARSIGYEYASRGRSNNLNIVEATRAFLFFRNTLLQSIVEVYQQSCVPSSPAWSEMLNNIHTYTDLILISLLETFQSYDMKSHEHQERSHE